MNAKRFLTTGLLLVVLALLAAPPARADTGPKSSMNFMFQYDTPVPLKIVSGTLLECSQPDCSDAAPLRHMGPQGFGCGESKCSSIAYGYAQYHRLSIAFSDGLTRESNVFSKRNYQARYTVRVLETSLQVRETGGTSRTGAFGWVAILYYLQMYRNPGLPVTIVMELLVGLVYVLWRRRPWLRVLLTVLLMNLFTQPLVWLVVKFMRLSLCAGTYLLELVVVLLEAWILYLVLQKKIKFRETFLLSLAMNLASFGLGLLLPF